jgi:hypothetical protein
MSREKDEKKFTRSEIRKIKNIMNRKIPEKPFQMVRVFQIISLMVSLVIIIVTFLIFPLMGNIIAYRVVQSRLLILYSAFIDILITIYGLEFRDPYYRMNKTSWFLILSGLFLLIMSIIGFFSPFFDNLLFISFFKLYSVILESFTLLILAGNWSHKQEREIHLFKQYNSQKKYDFFLFIFILIIIPIVGSGPLIEILQNLQ